MFDYNTYLKNSDSISFEEALKIYQLMCQMLEYQDDYLNELWVEVTKSALEYSKMRTEWNYLTREEKQAKDGHRTSLHNSFIINLKALCKFSQRLGLNNSWVEQLGSSDFRRRWGDFSGYIVCLETIKARYEI